MFNKFIGSAIVIACPLLAINSFAYELALIPEDIDLAVGFAPGSPVSENKPGETANDPSHSMNDFTQLSVIGPKYYSANNIAGLSVDQKVQKATVQFQPSAWGETYRLDIYYNGKFVGSGVSDGTNKVDILNFLDSGKVRIKVKKINLSFEKTSD